MISSFGFAVKHQAIASWPSVSALASAARSAVALVKRTEWPASTTARPSAIARCVLPTPGAPKIRTFSAWREKAAGRQLADEPLIDRRLEFEIEVVERLHRREVRDLQPHRDARALFGLDLLAEHAIEKVEIRRLGPGGVVEHGIEPLGDVAEAEPGELLDDAGMDDDAHWPPPATMAAYSARSRPSTASGAGAAPRSRRAGRRHRPS